MFYCHVRIHCPKPCMFMNKYTLVNTMKIAIILHNMIVGTSRGGYDSLLLNWAKHSVYINDLIAVNGVRIPINCSKR